MSAVFFEARKCFKVSMSLSLSNCTRYVVLCLMRSQSALKPSLSRIARRVLTWTRSSAFLMLQPSILKSAFVVVAATVYNTRSAERSIAIVRVSSGRGGVVPVLTVRPKIAELVFHLYGRALHPELFEVCSSTQVQRENYEAKIAITSTGHVVTWRHA